MYLLSLVKKELPGQDFRGRENDGKTCGVGGNGMRYKGGRMGRTYVR